METRDWSLVFFTVLTQAAVGAFLTLLVLRYVGPQSRSRAASEGLPLPGVLAVLSAGLFIALFHLATPLQAARAVVNFPTSWLSREIVFGSLFAALLGALVWRERKERAALPTAWLPALAAAAGLAFLYSQIAIYLLPAQPAWNSLATPAAFGGTALRLGILGVAAGLVVRTLFGGVDDPGGDAPASRPRTSATFRRLVLAGIAALAVEFLVVPLHVASLAADPLPAAAASLQRLTGDYGSVLFVRLGLLAAAAAALVGVLFAVRGSARLSGQSGHPSFRLASVLTCGAFGLVLVSEVCGRFLFYAMRVRVGI